MKTNQKPEPNFAELAELIQRRDLAGAMAFCERHSISPAMIRDTFPGSHSIIPLLARLAAADPGLPLPTGEIQ